MWDVDFKAILSLTSETPVDVYVQRKETDWTLSSFQSNVCRHALSNICCNLCLITFLEQ